MVCGAKLNINVKLAQRELTPDGSPVPKAEGPRRALIGSRVRACPGIELSWFPVDVSSGLYGCQ